MRQHKHRYPSHCLRRARPGRWAAAFLWVLVTAPAVMAGEVNSPRPQDDFFGALRALCGQAFEGHVETDRPAPAGADPFSGKRLVMHVRDCDDDVLRVPFHVGEDRSRTWVLRRTPKGLQLKHDHRHEDGSSDAVTLYGGDTRNAGTAMRQEFPVDAESVALFEAQGLSASVRNTWAIEVEPGQRFVYELARPNGRLFRVSFNLAQTTALPPPAWGQPGG